MDDKHLIPNEAPCAGTYHSTKNHLPTDAEARKGIPACSGLLDYFPDALLAVAELSRIGNDQHNLGKTLHWDRSKSTDEADCLVRHLIERGTIDTDGVRHSTKVAWRALALLQKEIENAGGVHPRGEPPKEVTGPESEPWFQAFAEECAKLGLTNPRIVREDRDSWVLTASGGVEGSTASLSKNVQEPWRLVVEARRRAGWLVSPHNPPTTTP